MFGKGLQYYPESVPQRTRDVDRARALVRESGVTTVELATGVTDPSWQAATQLVVDQLAEVGLTVRTRTVPPETYFSDVRANATFHFSRTGTLPVANWLATSQLTSRVANSYSRYTDPEIDRLHAAALAGPDEAARTEAIGRALTILHERVATPVWGVSDWIVAAHADVSGLGAYRPNTYDWANFARVSLG